MGIFVQAVRMSAGELGCTYAALILHDDGQEVTEEKMKQLLNAAKVDFEAYWPGLFVRALGSKDLNELIATPACGGGAAAGPAVAAAGDAGADAGGDSKKKEESEDEDEAMAPANIFGGDDDV